MSDIIHHLQRWLKEDCRLNVEKITTRKVSEIVAEKIEGWIQSGKVKPGDKLPSVRELCDSFDVGRSAVRDAITTLKGKGLLTVKQGEGAYVIHQDSSSLLDKLLFAKDISELFSVRKILEAGIVELAALNRHPKHLAKLKKTLQDLEQANTIEGWRADFDFHLFIAEASQNEILIQLMKTISTTTQKAIIDCHRIILSDAQLSQKVYQQHLAIYRAIHNKNQEQARLSMIEHLVYVEELLYQY